MIAPVEVVPNLWIGDLGRPYRGEYDVVLTISLRKPKTDDHLRHRWVELWQEGADWPKAEHLAGVCATWVKAHWLEGRDVLVQSAGYAWAEAVAATVLIHLGASPDEAVLTLRRARPESLREPSFLALLRAQ